MLCLRRRRKVICSGGQKSVGSSWLNVRGLAVQSCFASVLSFNEDALFQSLYVSKTLLYLLQEVTSFGWSFLHISLVCLLFFFYNKNPFLYVVL